jgi:hypothetical protein
MLHGTNYQCAGIRTVRLMSKSVSVPTLRVSLVHLRWTIYRPIRLEVDQQLQKHLSLRGSVMNCLV